MSQRSEYSCWLKKGDRLIMPSDNVVVINELESGAYNVKYNAYKDVYSVHKKDINTDSLIDIPQPETIEVIDSIKDFYEQREAFAEWGFVFKRGFLLYGVPGGGKTSIITNVMKFVIEQLNGIVFLVYDDEDLRAYAKFLPDVFRAIEKDRIVLTIFEDIDGMHREEGLLINVLDGIGNNNNVLNIATTNYTERLSERLINRPNRFDRRIEIKSPNYESRKFFFEKKIIPTKLGEIDLDKWVRKTEGFTMAQLSEVVKSVFLLGQSFEETIDILDGMKKIPNSANYNKDGNSPGLGFKVGGTRSPSGE